MTLNFKPTACLCFAAMICTLTGVCGSTRFPCRSNCQGCQSKLKRSFLRLQELSVPEPLYLRRGSASNNALKPDGLVQPNSGVDQWLSHNWRFGFGRRSHLYCICVRPLALADVILSPDTKNVGGTLSEMGDSPRCQRILPIARQACPAADEQRGREERRKTFGPGRPTPHGRSLLIIHFSDVRFTGVQAVLQQVPKTGRAAWFCWRFPA